MSDIYLQITETPTVVTLSAPVVSGALASTVTVANTVTVALDSNSLSALENVTVTVGAAITGTVTVSNFPASQAVTFSAVTISNFPASQTIAGTVAIGAGTAQIGSVTASISGTVPVSGTFFQATQPVSLTTLPALVAGTAQIGSVTVGNSVTIGSLPAISGTVTANLGTAVVQIVNAIQDGDGTTFGVDRDFPVSGAVQIQAGSNQIGSVTASISNSVTISANPAGPLTTRFGSVTTANTSQLTAAVTNTAREYLFIQNISVGSVTVGVGFSPTTTQGIQLSPGSGITFDSFCPTGAVWWLGATTGATWTILEG